MEPWVLAIVSPAILALVAAVWAMNRKDVDRIEQRLERHISEDNKVHEQIAVNSAEIKRLTNEIGDRTSGIRGWLHNLANDVSPYIIRKQGERGLHNE